MILYLKSHKIFTEVNKIDKSLEIESILVFSRDEVLEVSANWYRLSFGADKKYSGIR